MLTSTAPRRTFGRQVGTGDDRQRARQQLARLSPHGVVRGRVDLRVDNTARNDADNERALAGEYRDWPDAGYTVVLDA